MCHSTSNSLRLDASLAAKGYSLERVVQHVAYGRNGNATHPTITYRWTLKLNGRTVINGSKRNELVAAARTGLTPEGEHNA